MGKEHHLAERRHAVLQAVEQAGQISVKELSEQFQTSEVTIRQDLQALAEQNLLLRTRGGAMTIHALPELSFDVRQQQYAEQKARIGKTAAAMIHPGDSIVIDASTTAQAILPFLKDIPDLTIITNSLKVGINLLRMPQIQVLMPGGTLRRDGISLVGQPDQYFFEEFNARIGFFGGRGITLEQGLTDVNLQEARTKRKLMELCHKVVGILDGRKWGQFTVTTVAHLEEMHSIITDASAPSDLVEAVRERGIEVIIA